jgi:antitoxin component YwqK of YwqJK toxin-antitoxin module
MKLRSAFLALSIFLTCAAFAQPDSLYVPDLGEVKAYAIVYKPVADQENGTRVGMYAMDTSKIAVRLTYKRGKPCGTYRAFYPDGAPLIFAVYGWGWLHGDWTEYDPLGRVSLKGQYREGKRDGTWSFRSEGIVGHYKDGMKHGKWKYYENDKVVRVEKYYKDQLRTGTRFRIGGRP